MVQRLATVREPGQNYSHGYLDNTFSTGDTDRYGKPIKTANCQRHLGVVLASDLRWSRNVDVQTRPLGILKKLRSSLPASVAFYKMYIRPVLEYADVVWRSLSMTQADRLEHFQLRI